MDPRSANCHKIEEYRQRNSNVESVVGNLAKPELQIGSREAMPKQLYLHQLSDAGGSKGADVKRRQNPLLSSFVCNIQNEPLSKPHLPVKIALLRPVVSILLSRPARGRPRQIDRDSSCCHPQWASKSSIFPNKAGFKRGSIIISNASSSQIWSHNTLLPICSF